MNRHLLWKNGRLDRDAVWRAECAGGPNESCVSQMGVHVGVTWTDTAERLCAAATSIGLPPRVATRLFPKLISSGISFKTISTSRKYIDRYLPYIGPNYDADTV